MLGFVSVCHIAVHQKLTNHSIDSLDFGGVRLAALSTIGLFGCAVVKRTFALPLIDGLFLSRSFSLYRAGDT